MERRLADLGRVLGRLAAPPKSRLALYTAGLVGLGLLWLSLGGATVVDAPATTPLALGDLFLRLGVVLAIAYVSLLGLRSYLRRPGGAARGYIHVVERHRLGAQQTLYLVTVDDRALLLGATATSISKLGELGSAERYLEGEADSAPLPFSHHLRMLGILDRFSSPAGPTARRESEGIGRAERDALS